MHDEDLLSSLILHPNPDSILNWLQEVKILQLSKLARKILQMQEHQRSY